MRSLELDRRWIFLMLLVAVSWPLLANARFPEEPTVLTQGVYDRIEALPPGSLVTLALDYDQSSAPELAPMTTALLRHCCLKRHRLVLVTLWPTGVPIVSAAIRDVIEGEFASAKYVEGVDYVNLGYHTGEIVGIRLLMTNIRANKNSDVQGRPLDDIPLVRDIKGLRETDLILNVSAGYPGSKEWVQFATTRHGTPLAVGVVGVQGPLLLPYFPQQLQGLLVAVKGGAEYEVALQRGYPDFFADPQQVRSSEGLRRMGPQLWAHLLIVGLIVAGNIAYWWQSRGPIRGAAR